MSVTGTGSTQSSSPSSEEKLDKEVDKFRDTDYHKNSVCSFNGDRLDCWAAEPDKDSASRVNKKKSGKKHRSKEIKITVKVPKHVKNKKDYLKAVAQEAANKLGQPVKAKTQEDDEKQQSGSGGGGAPLNQFAQAAQTATDAFNMLDPNALQKNGTNPYNNTNNPPPKEPVQPNPDQTNTPPAPGTGEVVGEVTTAPPLQVQETFNRGSYNPNGDYAPDGVTPLNKNYDNPLVVDYAQMPSDDALAPQGTYRDVDPDLVKQLDNDDMVRKVYGTALGEAGPSLIGQMGVISSMVNRAQATDYGGRYGGKNMGNIARGGAYAAPQKSLSAQQLEEGRRIISAIVKGQLQAPAAGPNFRSSQYMMGAGAGKTASRQVNADPQGLTFGRTSRNNFGNSYYTSPNEKQYFSFIKNPSLDFAKGRTRLDF